MPDCSSLSITLKQNGDRDRPVAHWYAAPDVLSRLGAQINFVTSPVGRMSQQRRSVFGFQQQRNEIGLGRFQGTSIALVLPFSARSHFPHESSRTDSGRNGNKGGANTEARSSHATRVRLEIPGNQPR